MAAEFGARGGVARSSGLCVRVYTARYSNPAVEQSGLVPVRITVGHPRFRLRYELGGFIRELAPFGLRSVSDPDEFDQRYIAQLDALGADAIRKLLQAVSDVNGGRDLVLLCFEDLRDPSKHCHRTTFAEWWHQRTGEQVVELEEAS